MFRKFRPLGLLMGASALFAQSAARLDLGRLQTGATVSFTRSTGGDWGIEISGSAAPRIRQPKPAKLEIYWTDGDIRQLSAGYQTVQKTAAGVDARAEIAYGEVVFHISDRWRLSGPVLSLDRTVEVRGNAPGGFYSAVMLTVDPSVGWPDVNYMAPAALYGDPTYDGDRSPGGKLNYDARRFDMREDVLPAPLFALSFNDGASVAVLDPAPRGDTTVEEAPSKAVMTDARFQFGALGARQPENGPVEFGFWFPGSTTSYGGGRGAPAAVRSVRRYHPIAPGVAGRRRPPVLVALGFREPPFRNRGTGRIRPRAIPEAIHQSGCDGGEGAEMMRERIDLAWV